MSLRHILIVKMQRLDVSQISKSIKLKLMRKRIFLKTKHNNQLFQDFEYVTEIYYHIIFMVYFNYNYKYKICEEIFISLTKLL